MLYDNNVIFTTGERAGDHPTGYQGERVRYDYISMMMLLTIMLL